MALTSKQQAVYDRLERGKDVKQIAKELKISQSGVYGHMRKIKQSGVTLPEESALTNGGGTATATRTTTRKAPQVTSDNGAGAELDPRANVLAAIERAVAETEATANEIGGQIGARQEAIENAQKEVLNLGKALDRANIDLTSYKQAREALTTA